MYTLAALPYEYKALEPYIDTQTMEIHHTKHHQAYIDKLNAALDKHPELFDLSLEILLSDLTKIPEDIRSAVRNHGGGHFNHSFFWKTLKVNVDGKPGRELAKAIDQDFGDFETFKKNFTDIASTQFGSGWTWLSLNSDNKLIIEATPLQDNPIMKGLKPILGLDVWEHAYYLKYQNRRADYVAAFWNIINWETVEKNFESAK